MNTYEEHVEQETKYGLTINQLGEAIDLLRGAYPITESSSRRRSVQQTKLSGCYWAISSLVLSAKCSAANIAQDIVELESSILPAEADDALSKLVDKANKVVTVDVNAEWANAELVAVQK